MNKLTIIILTLLLSGCAGILSNRDFINEMNGISDGFFQAGDDFPVISGDIGKQYRSREEIIQRTPASINTYENRKIDLSLLNEREGLEQDLSLREKKEYLIDRKYLSTESEKIYYLGLNSRERKHYVSIKANFNSNMESNYIVKAITRGELRSKNINIGMSKKDVIDQWGNPSQVEFAGEPHYQNEKWTFRSTGLEKTLYFENGLVKGWEQY